LQPTAAALAQTVTSPVAAEPEIIFPTVKHNNAEFFGLDPVSPLSWSVAWFMPAPITGWPLLLDIDQTPFIIWERRIGR
jgi:hypothetical protein